MATFTALSRTNYDKFNFPYTGTQITSGDLNSITSPGSYYVQFSDKDNVNNKPYDDALRLQVFNIREETTAMVEQFAYTFYSGANYHRFTGDGGANWTDWRKIIDSNDALTLEEIDLTSSLVYQVPKASDFKRTSGTIATNSTYVQRGFIYTIKLNGVSMSTEVRTAVGTFLKNTVNVIGVSFYTGTMLLNNLNYLATITVNSEFDGAGVFNIYYRDSAGTQYTAPDNALIYATFVVIGG